MGTGSSISDKNTSRSTVTDYQTAVSGSASPLLLGSDEVSSSILVQGGSGKIKINKSSTITNCDLCSTSGDYIRAVGYCVDCTEYYCPACYRGHCRSKSTKHHNLMDFSNIYCDPCHTAGDKIQAEGFCSNCKEYYCLPCSRVHSRMKVTNKHSLIDKSQKPIIFKTPAPISTQSTTLASIPTQTKTPAPIPTQTKTPAPIPSQTKTPAPINKFHFRRDIKIKHPDEAKDCLITGISELSNTELVLIDKNNKSVKLLIVDKNIINDILYFDTTPFSITTLPDKEVAVTFARDRLIRILSTTGGLSVNKSIKLSCICRAVQYFNDKLYVAYCEPVQFPILSLSGEVKKTILPDAQVLHLCTVPAFIAIHPDESKMYVSDWENDVVLCMDMSGAMLAVYKDVALERPHAIFITPSGSLYVCNRDQHIIYHMTQDLTEAMVVLGPQDGLMFPTGMCFRPGRQSLYISSSSTDPKIGNVIKQYKYS